MGKAAIINPYFNTLGGGERYTVSFAKALIDANFQVDLEWTDPSIINLLENRFGIDLKDVNVVSNLKRGDGYDICFWVSDGSIPILHARHNILHFQVPFHGVGGRSLMNKMKFLRINNIVCNSYFTKKVIDAEYGVNSIVIYPPVDVERIKSKRKENIILSVARFSNLKQSKHQDILINVFKKMVDNGLKGWKLILAGGTEVGSSGLVSNLLDMSKGYPIEIIQSPNFNTVKNLYGTSKIFWTASGFNEDEIANPEKVEHFGMSLVEAMSSGNACFAYNAGGHKEIISDAVDGFLWNTESDLLDKTIDAINNKKLLNKISSSAKNKSVNFSQKKFGYEIKKII